MPGGAFPPLALGLRIAGVLLAGGSSTRFGGDKLQHRLADGRPLVVASLDALAPAVDETRIVVDDGNEELASLIAVHGGGVIVRCAKSRLGMSHSLRCGVTASEHVDAWLVALADMPFVQSASVAQVAAAMRDGAMLAAPFYRGRQGHPVGFARAMKAALLAVSGDAGARGILRRHHADLRVLECDDPGVVRDVDCVDDLMGA